MHMPCSQSDQDAAITLREVTPENLDALVDLSDPLDEGLVAPNALSIAEWALRDDAWMRAIYAGRVPVGLVMVQDGPDWHVYHVWRLMIGQRYHRRGFGRRAMEQVIDHYRRRPGAHALTTFVADRDGNAEQFYAKLGFERDGRTQMSQFGMALEWSDALAADQWPPVPDDVQIALEPVRSGMLRTIDRAYRSLPEEERQRTECPLTTIARARLADQQDSVWAVCAHGFPIGFAVCDAQGTAMRAICIAAPYRGRGFEHALVSDPAFS
jgi:diamine N-acetyltransferase